MEVLDITKFGDDIPLVDPDSCQVFAVPYTHIHLHVLQSDEEVKENGKGLTEICCHGCGATIIVCYSWDIAQDCADTGTANVILVSYADEFIETHLACAFPELNGHTVETEDFMYLCPSFRSDDVSVVDLTGEDEWETE